MEQAKEIVEGFYYLILKRIGLLNEDRMIVANLRKRVCDNCAIRSNYFGVGICDIKKGGCGCVLSAKQVSNTECPYNFWARETLIKFVP